MKSIIQLLIVIVFSINVNAQEVDTIKSIIGIGDSHEEKFESYKTNEFWALWISPIGEPKASNNLVANSSSNYVIENIHDWNLNTAWVVGKDNYGIGEYACFTLPYGNSILQYKGWFMMFNGYCKSLNTWQNNSRVKLFAFYYNDKLICNIELLDTWHVQIFDISSYVKSNRYDNGTLKDGDTFKFVILDVYKGDKYKEVAITELLMEESGN
jgi:hypothetical protein